MCTNCGRGAQRGALCGATVWFSRCGAQRGALCGATVWLSGCGAQRGALHSEKHIVTLSEYVPLFWT